MNKLCALARYCPPNWYKILGACFIVLPYLMHVSVLGSLAFTGTILWQDYKAIGWQLLRSGLVLVATLLLINTLQAVNIGEAVLQLSHFLPYFGLWGALVVYLTQHPQADTVLIRWSWSFVLGAAPIGIFALGEYWVSHNPNYSLQQLLNQIPPVELLYSGNPERSRAQAFFDNPNTLASYSVMIVGLIVGLLAAIETRPRQKGKHSNANSLLFHQITARISLCICLLSSLSSLYCSGSRNGYIAVIILLFLAVLALRRIPWIRWCGLLILGALTASIFTVGIRGHVPSWNSLVQNPRIVVWQQALQLFQENPWWGHGLGSYKLLYDGSILKKSYMGHAHNLWLSLLAEVGLIPTCALTIVIGFMLYRAARSFLANYHTAYSAITLGYGLCFVAALLLSLFDVTYYDARHNILAWVCLAAISSIPNLIKKSKQAKSVQTISLTSHYKESIF